MSFLPKFLTRFHQNIVRKWIGTKQPWKSFNYDFSSKISFLVSCCCICSFFLTESLTGLPWILSSDWLNCGKSCFISAVSHERHVGEKECRNDVFYILFQLFPSQLAQKKVEATKTKSFPYSVSSTATLFSCRICREKTAKNKQRYIFDGEKALVRCIYSVFLVF